MTSSAMLEAHFNQSTGEIPDKKPHSSSFTSAVSLDPAALRAKKFEKAGFHHKPTPFSMRWINGFNPDVPVINLNSDGSTILFYAAVNCGVLYNWTANTMKILQGHKNIVTSIASDAEGKWLVTADSGPENIIIIWDSSSNYPCKTLFSPHGEAPLAKLALSADAKYLLTLAYTEEQAELRWWMWSYGLDVPHAKLQVNIPVHSIEAMSFNPDDTKQFMMMNKQDLWIGVIAKILINERGVIKESNDYEIKIRKLWKKLTTDHGSLTCHTFVVNTKQLVVGTSSGAVAVFGYTMEYNENIDCTEYDSLKFNKVLKIEKHKINVIISIDRLIVTGNVEGEIRFYDEHLMLVYWVHGIKPDCVVWLSFNLQPRSYHIVEPAFKRCPCWEKVIIKKDSDTGLMKQILIKQRLPRDATTTNKPFLVRDFVLCTYNEGIQFVDFVTEKANVLVDCRRSCAITLTVHPEKHVVCLGSEDGCVTSHNFIQHKLLVRVDMRQHYRVEVMPPPDSTQMNTEIIIPELSVTCLKYSPSGLHLACGFNPGKLVFLDPVTMEVLLPEPEHHGSHPLKIMTYSPDSLALAIADSKNTVLVYKYNCENFLWEYVGKYRAHYKDLAAIFFLPKKNANGDYKLISLGRDRMMVEYDVGASNGGCLEIYSVDRFEQTAVPLGGIPWPNPAGLDPKEYYTELPLMLVANDEHKYKLVNYETSMTLSTVLGPRYPTPVRRLHLITHATRDHNKAYLLFCTTNIIGLQKLPLDGNPWKHCGILAHPVEVTEMCFREDLGFLFNIGHKDTCMIQWNAKYTSPDTIAKRGGVDLDPYYCLIEDGRPGWLFQEIRDLFYYIQIQCQGIFSPSIRRVRDYITIESLPDLMRAIGFYPSEYEVENLLCEAKYKVYQRNPSTEVNFDEFVKLYINHRPAFGDSFDKLKKAFQYFSDIDKESGRIRKETLLKTLKNYGENFSGDLSWYLLSILSGNSFDSSPQTSMNDFSFLNHEINFDEFVTYFLGLQNLETLQPCTSH